jgi:hypothetical protein
MKRVTLTVVLAACGSSPPPATPVAPQPDCAGVVATTRRFINTDHTPPAERERIAGVVALHCVEDQWPVQATSCITAAADLAGAHACMGQHLTVVVHDRLMAALRAEPMQAAVVERPPPPALEPETTVAPASGSQAAIAAKLNDDGSKLFLAKSFADASMKFRDAVARVPEPRYFFNLCLSLYQEGKFAEALTACDAGTRQNPPALLRAKLDKASNMIRGEANAQGVNILE